MKKILTIVFSVLITANIANAKWWIFGKSKDEVSIKYMTINSISAEESARKMTLFKETLKDGKVLIKGKAYAGKGATVGSVRYSLDGKNTWQEAKFSENGDFEFSFTPEKGKTYKMYIEITNTAGKTNNIEDTYKELELSEENISAKIREVLDGMFKSYSDENLTKFMSYVSPDFAGDRDFLELAVKKDFNSLNNIRITYSINNIASGPKGIAVSLTYNRSFLSNKSGSINTDNGITEMVFKLSENKPVLYSMKKPLLFGLSDADNVATGITAGQNEGIIIDESGDVGGSVETISISCSGTGGDLHPLYYFSNGDKGCHPSYDMGNFSQIGEFIIYDTQAELQHNGQVKVFNKSINSLTPAEVKDLSGYTQPVFFNISTGKSYGIYIYGKFYAVEFIAIPAPSGQQNTTFKLRSF
ncbi:MAG: hypothetical protein ACP5SD_04980 [Elusimicrobiales bacterium]